jgi:hypothetical protein
MSLYPAQDRPRSRVIEGRPRIVTHGGQGDRDGQGYRYPPTSTWRLAPLGPNSRETGPSPTEGQLRLQATDQLFYGLLT